MNAKRDVLVTRSKVFRCFFSMLFFLLLSSPVFVFGADLLFDNFDSYLLGSTPPLGGWQIYYGGAGNVEQYVDNTYAVSGSQSFRSKGGSCYAAAIYQPLTLPSKVRFETNVYIDQLVAGGCSWPLITQAHMGLWRPSGPERAEGRIHC